MNVVVIKKTKDLARMTMSEVMVVIKSCHMDDKQCAIDHASSYNTSGYHSSINYAFATQDGLWYI